MYQDHLEFEFLDPPSVSTEEVPLPEVQPEEVPMDRDHQMFEEPREPTI